MKFLLVWLVLVIFVGNVFAETPPSWQTRREEVQTRIEERREELQVRKEERLASVSARREEIRTRLQAVRDEKKLQLLEKIEEKFAQINQRRTGHFLKVLDRLREILAKIQSRTDRAEANGKNVSGVDAAIAKATAAIDAAETAVNTQADKVYEITVSDETTARNDVGALMKKLQEDLRVTRDWVQKARTAVFDSLQALVQVVGNDGGVATPSATPT
jgi:gluconate kinase